MSGASSDRLECATCPVRERAACAALDEAQRGDLARLGRRRRVARGDTVFAAGDDSGSCATLVSGALKIASYGVDGTERVLSLVHPAGFVGEMFAPVAHHDVVAIADSELFVFSRADYDEAIDRFPALAKALLRRSTEELFTARSLVELQSRGDSRGRVAAFLLAMARAASHSPCHAAERFDLPLTRGEIASLLGITIETVSRQLTALEKEGVIGRAGPRGIELRDPERLENLAG
ncbi:Crp/Fnr family transcriptional regulator [Sphingomonas sp. LY160]|uniref:Crp/Fnr family transcriptional regulator n=1 Tax=Sphingomonas sp. LY160 TaxID=3095342 RepID=UPI002ADEDB9B|nr:Crp/Fnr family transcriptional regulator [Sphingomonas sp. LY160]MEA1072450.1 Crp/Fnr family transcriptional regulator [Sphingomonas sp. LY160]